MKTKEEILKKWQSKDMSLINWIPMRLALKAMEEYAQQAQPDMKYDEKYLNECIKKAKPNLSKIKDVDKALDEIRGIESDKDLIIAKQEELIEFYGKIIRDSAVFLQIHHAGASPEEIETGKRLRQELQTLKSK